MHRFATFLRHWLATATLAVVAAVISSFPAPAQEVESLAPTDRQIVISLPDRRLYLMEEGAESRSFPVAIGRPGVAIPLGDTTVVRKRRNPTWHPTASQRRAKPSLPLSVPPGPSNPLGKFALDLGWAAIAIHGTNEPGSIGRRVSSGCFRMMPSDIETLFAVAEVGTPVRVVDVSMKPPETAPIQPSPTQPKKAAPKPLPPVQVAKAPPQPTPAVPAVLVPAVAPAPAPVAAPTPVIPDPRCSTATAPLRRMICANPDLAALDGRARGMQERFLTGLPPDGRAAAAYALLQDERRFDDRVTALCWIRKGSEADPAVVATAQACLRAALAGRMEDVQKRIAELGGVAMARR